MATIWSSVLSLGSSSAATKLSRDSNFVAMGGDSLNIVRMVRILRERKNLDRRQLPIMVLARAETLHAMAAAVDSACANVVGGGGGGGGAEVGEIDTESKNSELGTSSSNMREDPSVPLSLFLASIQQQQQQDIERVLPLTSSQSGLLFECLKSVDSLYVEQLVWRIEGVVDVSRLGRAWTALVRRHPMLRTSFDVASWKFPVQVVRKGSSDDNVVMIDVVVEEEETKEEETKEKERKKEEEEKRPSLQAYLSMDRKRGMDVVGDAPLLRAAVVSESSDATDKKISQKISHFVLTIHHIIFDGWSLSIMLEELKKMYDEDGDHDGGGAGKAGGEEEKRISEVSTSRLLSYLQWEQKKDMTKSLRYWRNLFEGYQPPPPLVAAKISSSASFSSRRHVARLGTSVAASIRDVARLWGVTPNAIAQACFVLATREDDDFLKSDERSHFEMV